jgi:plasmid stability protein
MANVLVRDLDDVVLRQLKAAAKAHGRSLQAEIHDVLQRASTPESRRNAPTVGTVAEAIAQIIPVGQRRDGSRGSR